MKKNESFDLASIDPVAACNVGHEFELKHPSTEKPLGIFLTVLGSESDPVREYRREKLNERLRNESMAKKRGKDLPIQTVQDFEESTIEVLLITLVGWRMGDSPTITFEGQQLEFNLMNARKVLTKLPWIREQINEETNLENFMKS